MKEACLVLDHGYIKYVDHMGSDASIIEAARMSTDKGFLGWGTPEKPGDEKLLKYLWEHHHATPFEMCELAIEVQARIMVFREWHRHRTQSYNEMSARYIQMPDLHYVPTLDRLKAIAGANKQAQGTAALAEDRKLQDWLWNMEDTQRDIYEQYELGLKLGIPKEVARGNTPVFRYSRMRAKANLRNWFAFLTLRDDVHAQWEIQQYAKVVAYIVSELFPKAYEIYFNELKEQRLIGKHIKEIRKLIAQLEEV